MNYVLIIMFLFYYYSILTKEGMYCIYIICSIRVGFAVWGSSLHNSSFLWSKISLLLSNSFKRNLLDSVISIVCTIHHLSIVHTIHHLSIVDTIVHARLFLSKAMIGVSSPQDYTRLSLMEEDHYWYSILFIFF